MPLKKVIYIMRERGIYQYSVEEGISSGVPSDPESHQVTTQLSAERERERVNFEEAADRETVKYTDLVQQARGSGLLRSPITRTNKQNRYFVYLYVQCM